METTCAGFVTSGLQRASGYEDLRLKHHQIRLNMAELGLNGRRGLMGDSLREVDRNGSRGTQWQAAAAAYNRRPRTAGGRGSNKNGQKITDLERIYGGCDLDGLSKLMVAGDVCGIVAAVVAGLYQNRRLRIWTSSR